jgi:hypothetical protein
MVSTSQLFQNPYGNGKHPDKEENTSEERHTPNESRSKGGNYFRHYIHHLAPFLSSSTGTEGTEEKSSKVKPPTDVKVSPKEIVSPEMGTSITTPGAIGRLIGAETTR